ncbi:hypothetical protein [Bathymodiolus platifrons methanotrophic gill symbiont]|uniref:hypothetical protein n=1 Tax=Bathymodiolus platifrons methanotrophic gill symbiont TaxID=113268 RepID=UPI000B418838
MAFYFVSTFANAQTPTKQRPYGYRGLKIITSLRLRFPDFQRLSFKNFHSAQKTLAGIEIMKMIKKGQMFGGDGLSPAGQFYSLAA